MRGSATCLALITGAFHSDGGIASINRLVLRAIHKRGYQLDTLVLSERDSSVEPNYFTEGQLPEYIPFSSNKYQFTLAAWHRIFRRRYRFVFIDHVNLASLVAPLAAARLCRYAVWLHGVEVFPPRPDWLGRMGLLHAARQLASSDYTRKAVLERYPSLPVKTCLPSLDPVRHALACDQSKASGLVRLQAVDGEIRALGQRVIVHVGRMSSGHRDKGQSALLLAFEQLARDNSETQLVLAGDGEDRQGLITRARVLPPGVRERIFLPGHVSDSLLADIYRNSFAVAMPSVGEGFGLVYLEAMSYGKPCLGTRANATPGTISDGITGVLVENAQAPEQLASALGRLLNDPCRAMKMGQNGEQLVRSRYLFPHFEARLWAALSGW